jgi:hypothetical protein
MVSSIKKSLCLSPLLLAIFFLAIDRAYSVNHRVCSTPAAKNFPNLCGGSSGGTHTPVTTNPPAAVVNTHIPDPPGETGVTIVDPVDPLPPTETVNVPVIPDPPGETGVTIVDPVDPLPPTETVNVPVIPDPPKETGVTVVDPVDPLPPIETVKVPVNPDPPGETGVMHPGVHPVIPVKNESGRKTRLTTGAIQGATGKISNQNFVGKNQIHLHVQTSDGKSNTKFIPPKPGRNFVDGYRAYFVDSNGKVENCILSGLGRRKVTNHNGSEWIVGHSESIHFKSSTTAHLPSNHGRKSALCICSVSKHIRD